MVDEVLKWPLNGQTCLSIILRNDSSIPNCSLFVLHVEKVLLVKCGSAKLFWGINETAATALTPVDFVCRPHLNNTACNLMGWLLENKKPQSLVARGANLKVIISGKA